MVLGMEVAFLIEAGLWEGEAGEDGWGIWEELTRNRNSRKLLSLGGVCLLPVHSPNAQPPKLSPNVAKHRELNPGLPRDW